MELIKNDTKKSEILKIKSPMITHLPNQNRLTGLLIRNNI